MTALAYSYSHVASAGAIEPVIRLSQLDATGGSLTLNDWARRAQQQAPIEIAEPALAKLDQLRRLGPDWDSYGASQPSSLSLSMARAIVLAMVRHFVVKGVPTEVMPIADGGVQLEWRGKSGELALNAAPDGSWSYLLIERDGDERVYTERYGLQDAEAVALVANFLGQ